MVERRELITICRQIGTMMEVGVDFLRITKALRDQTDNPRLLELYEQFDEDLKMGQSVSDAMSNAPDVFSPFAVSLVRQGEKRGDIEGAWHKIADYLRQEAREDKEFGLEEDDLGTGYIPTRGLPSNGLAVVAPRAPVTVGMLSDLIDRLQSAALRGLAWVSALLLSLAAARGCVEVGWVDTRYLAVIQLCTAALFLAFAGVWLRSRLENDRKKQPRCSFCGKSENEVELQRSSRLAGAAICTACTTSIAQSHSPTPIKASTPVPPPVQEKSQEEKLSEFADSPYSTVNKGAMGEFDELDEFNLNGHKSGERFVLYDEDDPLAP